MRLNYIDNIDCLEGLKEIPDNSVDLVVTDPPYGTMRGLGKGRTAKEMGYAEMNWDTSVAPSVLFDTLRRVLRPNGKAVIFAQEPYTSNLITGAMPELPFSYRAIWKKDSCGLMLGCNKAMLCFYEDICVFSKIAPKHDFACENPLRDYFRQVLEFIGAASCKEINAKLGPRRAEHCFYVTNGKRAIKKAIGGAADHCARVGSSQFSLCTEETYQQIVDVFGIDKMHGFQSWADLRRQEDEYREGLIARMNAAAPSVFNLWEGNKYKSNVLEYPKDYPSKHPTQKPVALIEDLVRTYSNPGDVVLDPFMGSGTTAVACIKTGRNFIGFELDEGYHAIAQKRIADTMAEQEGEDAWMG